MRSFRALPAIALAFWVLLLVFSLAGLVHAEKHPPAKPIDLNAANAKELQELPGVGPVTAQRIIDLREKSGRFKRVEDLLAVRGISQKKLDAMRPYVTVSAQPSTATPSQKAAPPSKSRVPELATPAPRTIARLRTAERIPDRDGEFGHSIAPVLIGQVRYIVNIELRLDEDVRFDVQLHSHGAMNLEVIGGGK